MDFLPIRLLPDADLRRTLEATLGERRYDAAYVIGGIGSLRQARLQYAGKNDAEFLDGDLEILTLSGSLSPDGVHLHMSVADATGRVIGGHVPVRWTRAPVFPNLLSGASLEADPSYQPYIELLTR